MALIIYSILNIFTLFAGSESIGVEIGQLLKSLGWLPFRIFKVIGCFGLLQSITGPLAWTPRNLLVR
jgi:hypothetical protein